MTPARIAAIADVHSPRYLHDFQVALLNHEVPDLLLFAGDMINRGKVDEYINIIDAVESQLGRDFPILACFGNEEPLKCQNEIKKTTKGFITFLDDKSQTLKLAGSAITVIGVSGTTIESSRSYIGALEELQTTFEKRALRLSGLLQKASKSSEYVILLMHFSPLLENDPNRFSWWVEKVVENCPPNLIIHGHIHDGIQNEVRIGATVIRNVALPATGRVTEMNLPH